VRRVALKVDCDTYVGTRDGIPRLLEILGARKIRASFFFTFGPDRSGRAARRFFTTPGFFQKMLHSRAGSLYGFPTVLYGTLLPAPVIGERCEETIHSVAQAGHETGVHAWDHVGWHDHLDRWTEEKIRDEYGRAHDVPGLVITDASVLPGSTYVNPQITIMALAARSARHIAAEAS